MKIGKKLNAREILHLFRIQTAFYKEQKTLADKKDCFLYYEFRSWNLITKVKIVLDFNSSFWALKRFIR